MRAAIAQLNVSQLLILFIVMLFVVIVIVAFLADRYLPSLERFIDRLRMNRYDKDATALRIGALGSTRHG